jgi:hypothetical protein
LSRGEEYSTGIGQKSLELSAVKGGAQKSVKQLSLKRMTSIGTGISAPGNPEPYTFTIFAQGSLSLLEVVWYNFPDPVPTTWIETSRRISVGETEEGVG